jgi:glycosyltransferase involved in cell wall biosynthesis
MRIAIVNWSRRRVGGAERYLSEVMADLAREGHQVGLWHEVDLPTDREQIPLPEGAPAWCVARLGVERALSELRAWGPELVFTHIVSDPEVEAEVIRAAPAVFFAHAYYGTCISGTKTHALPTPTPCGRRFGAGCLLRYYPRRCGGLSPLTMLRDYGRQSRRLELLGEYRAVVTNSAHLREEYVRHGVDPARVHTVPLPVAELPGGGAERGERGEGWRLLFLGRMDPLKGGGALLDALPEVAAALGVPLHVTFVGDGPARGAWERGAAAVRSRTPGLTVEFTGWMEGPGLEALWERTDLLVVPSLWPEPFGLVGPEAGVRGIPAAGFAVGGIPDWLEEGVNGALAPADPPTAAGLSAAIVRALRDPDRYAALRRGARERARRFSRERHLRALTAVFEGVLGRGEPGTAAP